MIARTLRSGCVTWRAITDRPYSFQAKMNGFAKKSHPSRETKKVVYESKLKPSPGGEGVAAAPNEVFSFKYITANTTSSVSFVDSLPLGMLNHRAGSLALSALVSQASFSSLHPSIWLNRRTAHCVRIARFASLLPRRLNRRAAALPLASLVSPFPTPHFIRHRRRSAPEPRFIPPSGSIGALSRCRSHRLFRQPPPHRPFPPLAGAAFRSHRRRFGSGATGGAKLRNSRGSLLERLPLGGCCRRRRLGEVLSVSNKCIFRAV